MTNQSRAGGVGDLLMFGFEGTTVDELPRDLIAQTAGVILFKRNIRSAQQVRDLTDGIRAMPRETGIPPLVAIDQEGGSVSRLAGVGTTTPSAMALGAAGDPSLTESMYRLIGDELAALGINLDLAPVADINNNPDNPSIGVRSFGDDPHAVGLHVRAAIRGLRAAGIGATAKHFPGYGDAAVDPHVHLPTIRHELDRMRAVEFIPFAAAIAEDVDAIMTAHALFAALEQPAKPATLSRRVLTGLLREELRYDGAICTDCMEMQAIAAHYSAEESALEAVLAGADLVLFSHSIDKTRGALDALRAAVRTGRFSTEQIDQSLRRVRSLQQRVARTTLGASLETVGSTAHVEAALAAARRAVTLVRDPKSILPLRLNKGERLLVVEFAGPPPVAVEDGDRRRTTVIGPALAQSPARLHEQVRTLDPAGHEYKQLLMASASAHAVVAITSRAWQHPLQARAVADLAMLGKRVIVVAGREPYDAEVLPPEVTVLASFGEDPNAMHAAADVILGSTAPSGTLPVSLRSEAGATP